MVARAQNFKLEMANLNTSMSCRKRVFKFEDWTRNADFGKVAPESLRFRVHRDLLETLWVLVDFIYQPSLHSTQHLIVIMPLLQVRNLNGLPGRNGRAGSGQKRTWKWKTSLRS